MRHAAAVLRVVRSAGFPAAFPVGGLAGQAKTSFGGAYAIQGAMPPIGFPQGMDSLLVTCEVIAGPGFA
jgi:hypothetical protein